MPPLHGQHQTILMFLSLYDVNSSEDQTIKPCGKGLMIWSALVFILVRVTLSVIEANHLSRTTFFCRAKKRGDAFGDCTQSPVAHCFFAVQKSLVEPRRIELLTS
jgi:hypothetical protein